MADNLMTVEQFNLLVRKWGLRVKMLARGTLSSGTHSSRNLQNFLTLFVDNDKKTGSSYKLKFHFERYGVFRAYGAGRGYVVVNGQILRGSRLRSNREIKNRTLSDVTRGYLSKGYTLKEINRLKVYSEDVSKPISRTPLDWIDQHIDANISQLADVVQEYHGDKALRDLLLDFNNVKIVKNGR